MSKITNDDLTRSGTGCFIAVPIPYGNSWRQRATIGTRSRTMTYRVVDDDASSSGKHESKRHENHPKDERCDDEWVSYEGVKEQDRIMIMKQLAAERSGV